MYFKVWNNLAVKCHEKAAILDDVSIQVTSYKKTS